MSSNSFSSGDYDLLNYGVLRGFPYQIWMLFCWDSLSSTQKMIGYFCNQIVTSAPVDTISSQVSRIVHRLTGTYWWKLPSTAHMIHTFLHQVVAYREEASSSFLLLPFCILWCPQQLIIVAVVCIFRKPQSEASLINSLWKDSPTRH